MSAWLSNVARALFLPFSSGTGSSPYVNVYGRCDITYETINGISFSFASMDMTYTTLGTEQLTWGATDTGNLEAT